MSAARRPPTWVLAAVALGSTVAAALLIDVLAWTVLDRKPPAWAAERFFQASPLTGHAYRPNASGTWYAYQDGSTSQISINGFGYSDAPRALAAERPRIALVGDSTSAQWEAPAGARGHDRLETRLDGAFEVLNFGIRAFGTDQSTIAYETAGQYFRPQIVVHLVCVNDIDDNARTTSKPHYELDPSQPCGVRLVGYPTRLEAGWDEGFQPWYLTSPSFLYRRGYLALQQVKWAIGGRTPPPPLDEHFELRVFKKDYDTEDERRMAIMRGALCELAASVRRSGAKLLIVDGLYAPVLDQAWKTRVGNAYGDILDNGKLTRILREEASRLGAAFVSLPEEVTRRKLDVFDLMHSEDTMHLNGRGAELFADVIAEELIRLRWVDA